MPQQPSKSNPASLVDRFRGLNDQQDSVFRPPGTVTNNQNVLDEQTGDANRRAGRDFERLGSEAVGIIYQLTWNDNRSSIITGWGGLSYDDFTDSSTGIVDPTDPNTPGPLPNFPNYIPQFKSPVNIPDLTSLMRAISEALRQINFVDVTWPDQVWAFNVYDVSSGTAVQIGSAIRTRELIQQALSAGYRLVPFSSPISPPSDGRDIAADFYYADYRAAGIQYVISHLGVIITNYNSTLTNFVKTRGFEGSTAISDFTIGDVYSTSPSISNWLTVWTELAALINNNLLVFQLAVSQGSPIEAIVEGGAAFSSIGAAQSCTNLNIELGREKVITDPCTVIINVPTGASGVENFSEWNTASSIPRTRIGRFSPNLDTSAYNEDDFSGGDLFFKMSYWGRPLSAPTRIYPSSDFSISTFSRAIGQTPEIGENWTGSQVGSIQHDLTATGTTVGTISRSGWVVNSMRAILYRNQQYEAFGPGSPSANPQVGIKDEFFRSTQLQSVTSETSISWNQVKLGEFGAISRNAYSFPNGEINSITATTGMVFNNSNNSFIRLQERGQNKPFVLGILNLQTTITSGSPTSLTLKLYINETLVTTNSGVSLSNAVLVIGFSFKGLGEFGTNRPPQNDPGNNLDGWQMPVTVRWTVTPNAGTIQIGPSTTFTDWLFNYPF